MAVTTVTATNTAPADKTAVQAAVDAASDGDTLLSIDIPDNVIADYEWIEEEKPYREFLIPAEIVNRYGPPKVEDVEPYHIKELRALLVVDKP